MSSTDRSSHERGPRPGDSAELWHTVTDGDTAAALGSGDVAVLATPRLLALAEAATVATVRPRLDDGQTSVGTRVNIEHLIASPVGATVVVRAQLVHVDGRLLRFEVAAEDDRGRLVGRAQITRVTVDRMRFQARAQASPRSAT